MSRNSTDNYEDGGHTNGQDGFVAAQEVKAGEIYYLLVDNWSTNSVGFTLDLPQHEQMICPCATADLLPEYREIINTPVTIDAINTNSEANPADIRYEWNTGETTPSIIVDIPGSYSVSLNTENTNCASSRKDTEVIYYIPPPEIDEAAVDLCVNSAVNVEVNNSYANTILRWYDSDGNLLTEDVSTYDFDAPGDYMVPFW